jgi:gliding motility-associated-like protein
MKVKTKPILGIIMSLIFLPAVMTASNIPGFSSQYGFFKLNSQSPNAEFKYLYQNKGVKVYFTEDEVIYHTYAPEGEFIKGNRIDLTFKGSQQAFLMEEQAVESLPYAINVSLKGDLYSLQPISSLTYGNLYKGIDLTYYLDAEGKLMYKYDLEAEADPSVIQVEYNGADKIEVDTEGNLNIYTAAGILSESGLHTFTATQKEVNSSFSVQNSNILQFKVQAATNQALTIDPKIDYTTYYGGTSEDYAYGIAVDDSLRVYVVGSTSSDPLPDVAGNYQDEKAENDDGYIIRFNPNGTLAWATYYGGSEVDIVESVDVDNTLGRVYMIGRTNSEDLPGTTNSRYGDLDAFITAFDTAGNFITSRYLGGTSFDRGEDIVILNDQIYVTGYTSGGSFPTTPGAAQPVHAGGDDAFFTILDTGLNVIYSSFFGGSEGEGSFAIGVNSNDEIVIAGRTFSTNFPILTPNPTSVSLGGEEDAFVAKFSANGTPLFSTLMGGTGLDVFYDLTIDSSDNIYLSGRTKSPNINFPGNPYKDSISNPTGDRSDILIAMYNNAGILQWGTYFGGSAEDVANGMDVTAAGIVTITGETESNDYPVTPSAEQPVKRADADAFILQFDRQGILLYSSYLGGNDFDYGRSIFYSTDETEYYVAGNTRSTDFPVATVTAYQPFNAGNNDAFIKTLCGLVSNNLISFAPIRNGNTFNPILDTIIFCSRNEPEPDVFGTVSRGGSGNTNEIFQYRDSSGMWQNFTLNFEPLLGYDVIPRFVLLSDRFVQIRRIVADGPVGISSDCIDTSNVIVVDSRISPIAAFRAEGTCDANNVIDFYDETDTTGSGSIIAYNWKFGRTIPFSVQENPQNVQFPRAGFYNIRLTVTASNTCFDFADSTIVVGADTTEADFTYTTGCEDETLYFQNTSADSSGQAVAFFWDFGDGTTSTMENPVKTYASPGRYFVEFTTKSADSCVSFIRKEVSTNAIFADFEFFNVSCNGLQYQFNNLSRSNTTDSIDFYRWDFGDGTTSTEENPFKIYTNAGPYTVKLVTGITDSITNGIQCIDSTTMTLNAGSGGTIDVSFTSTADCSDEAVQFFNTTSTTETELAYFWDFGDGTTSTEENPLHIFPGRGIYPVTLTITNANNTCSGSETKLIAVRDRDLTNNLVAGFYSNADCSGLTVQFFDSSRVVGGTIDRYIWIFGDGDSAFTRNPIHTFPAAGQYDVRLIIFSSDSCVSTVVDSNLTINSSSSTVDASLEYTVGCSNSVQFNSTSTATTGVDRYIWVFGDGDSAFVKSPIHTYPAIGNYNVSLFVFSTDSCLERLDTSVTITSTSASVNANFDYQNLCLNEDVGFVSNSSANSGIAGYIWDFGNGDSAFVANPSYVYNTSGTYNVTLVVISNDGCRGVITRTITISPKPELTVSDDRIINKGESVDLSASANVSGGTYAWAPASSLSSAFIPNPRATPMSTTNYMVTYTNPQGCSVMDSVLITVEEGFLIPGVFTPNGDGDNDEFVIRGIGEFPLHNVKIFNRWGSLLYEVTGSYDRNPWDGTYEGEAMPMSAYYYIIDLNNGTDEYKGTVSILR